MITSISVKTWWIMLVIRMAWSTHEVAWVSVDGVSNSVESEKEIKELTQIHEDLTIEEFKKEALSLKP